MLSETPIGTLVDLWRVRAARRSGEAQRLLETVAIELEHAIRLAAYEAERDLTVQAVALGMCDPDRPCARCPNAVETPHGTLCADCLSRSNVAREQKRRRAEHKVAQQITWDRQQRRSA